MQSVHFLIVFFVLVKLGSTKPDRDSPSSPKVTELASLNISMATPSTTYPMPSPTFTTLLPINANGDPMLSQLSTEAIPDLHQLQAEENSYSSGNSSACDSDTGNDVFMPDVEVLLKDEEQEGTTNGQTKLVRISNKESRLCIAIIFEVHRPIRYYR